jgi:hypothetical protein
VPEALPGVSASSPPAYSRAASPLLRVVSPADLDEQDRQRLAAMSEANRPRETLPADIGAYVRQRWMVFRNHRSQGANDLNNRLLRAQRMFEGQYDPQKLVEIKKFGGSEVYSRLVAVKCRGATALLRDVYLGSERPWNITPQSDPDVPPEVRANIMQLLSVEAAAMQEAGQPVLPDQLHMRFLGLMHSATQAARRVAMTQAETATNKVDEILEAGRFYDALAQIMADLPLFPFAVLKGPVVRMVPRLTWLSGQPTIQNKPQMFWERVDPFHVYWSPGATRVEDSEIIERQRLTRADLNDLLGLPGYDQAAVRGALQDYDHGLRDWMDSTDTEAALNQGRENPTLNQSNMIDAIEYHGNVQGRMLLEQGVEARLVPDLDRDYAVQTWIVGRYVLKTQLTPSPRQRHPYYITSFEKVPGTILGHGLPDILEDLQEIANATLRALVNNMAIASGPQVVVNDAKLSPTESGDDMYPWKRWHVQDDPMGSASKVVEFFQPNSNSQELLGVYSAISGIADDISAIPRYVTGESLKGGAGRTASGLSMLMNNSSKVLQTVAANVDIDIMRPALTGLYDMIMLTDTSGMLTGEEQIRVNGVTVAVQQETARQKQLQFLQITANPIDAPILGKLGRARVLRSVAQGLGMPDDVVPDDNTLEQQMRAEQQMAEATTAMAIAQGQPDPNDPNAEGKSSPGSKAQGQQSRAVTPARHSDNAPPFNAFQQGVPTNGR